MKSPLTFHRRDCLRNVFRSSTGSRDTPDKFSQATNEAQQLPRALFACAPCPIPTRPASQISAQDAFPFELLPPDSRTLLLPPGGRCPVELQRAERSDNTRPALACRRGIKLLPRTPCGRSSVCAYFCSQRLEHHQTLRHPAWASPELESNKR